MKKTVPTIGLALLFILVACSSAASPAPTTTPQPGAPSSAPTPSSAALSPEDAAWAKVVEAAKKEGTLTIYSFNLVGDIGTAVSRAFKDKYGISPDIITGRGAEFLERLKTERRIGKLLADVNDGSSAFVKSMIKEGLTVSVAKELPVLREKGVWRVDPFSADPVDRHAAAMNFTIWSPWINVKQVKAGEEPRVWKDLLAPKWKGMMMLTDPTTSPGAQQYFVPLIREKVIDEDFLKAIYRQDIKIAGTLPDEGLTLSRGERVLSIRGSDSTYPRFVTEGAPIKAIDLEDGVIVTANPLLVALDGPHPNAAKLYYNWFLSKEGLRVWAGAASVASIRNDIGDFRPEAAQVSPRKPILLTDEDNETATRLFRERWLDKLWGR